MPAGRRLLLLVMLITFTTQTALQAATMAHARAFTVLTYNVNDLSLSDASPPGWTQAAQHAALRDLVLQLQPDLLCLQEAFDDFPPLLTEAYEWHGQVPSHRGSCRLATRREGPLAGAGGEAAFEVGPAVVAPLRLHGGEQPIYAACAHLAPFADNWPRRARQLARIVEAVPPGAPLVFAGDANMREGETGAGDNGLADAWVAAGSHEAQRWSWNTHVNRYYRDGRKYQDRYDRVFTRGFSVLGFELAGNQPASSSSSHFLSDHFGILATLQLQQRQQLGEPSRQLQQASAVACRRGGSRRRDCMVN